MARPIAADSPMPWVKIYSSILENTRVLNLSDGAQLCYIKLIVLAGKCDAEGALVVGDRPMTAQEIGKCLRIRSPRIERELKEISNENLIYFEDSCWFVRSFSEKQGRSQNDKRNYWRAKQHENRQNHANVNVDNPNCQSIVKPVEKSREEKSRENTRTLTPDATATVTEAPKAEAPTVTAPTPIPSLDVFRRHFPDVYMRLNDAQKDEIVMKVGDCDRFERVCRAYELNAGWKRDNIGRMMQFYDGDCKWPDEVLREKRAAERQAQRGKQPPKENVGDIAIRMVLEKHGYGSLS